MLVNKIKIRKTVIRKRFVLKLKQISKTESCNITCIEIQRQKEQYSHRKVIYKMRLFLNSF